MTGETIYSLFSSAADDDPDRPFLWSDSREISYGDASRTVDRYATLLRDCGVDRGDHVSVLSGNCPAFVHLLLATAKLGATFVPLDYRQQGDVLEYLLADAAPSLLVVGERAYDSYAELSDTVDVDEVLYRNVNATESDASLQEALDATETDASVGNESDPTDVAIVNYTSGSTGPPKGVQNPHRAFVEAGARIADHCGTDADDRGLVVLPLFHANPQTYALMHMLSVGGSIALAGEFSASGFWPTARASESTFFTHVGSVLEILHRTAANDDVDTETPLEFTLGGAAQFEAQETFESTTGIQIIRLYGLSEMGAGVITMNRRVDGVHGADHQGSISDQPFDVRILDSSGARWSEPGERGEIVVRPELPGTMFVGYLDKHRETVEAWRDLWMHTGDLGWIDDEDNLHYVGRLKTSIRKNGENVSPWEIETIVTEFSSVTEAVAVGVPDSVAGEEIKLYVVPSNGDVSEAEIHRRCREGLSDHLVPRYVALLDDLPRTSTQKVERMTLKNRDASGAWDSEAR